MNSDLVKMRVELIQNPELPGLTKKEIDKFKEEYAVYKEKVQQQEAEWCSKGFQ